MPTIRPARDEDGEAIARIYNEAGIATTATYALEPVTAEERRAWLARLVRDGFPVLVLVGDNEVLGYASYGPFRPLAGYRHTVEHSVYMSPQHRSRGGGRALMSALIDRARDAGAHVMVGLVDAENAESLAFHHRLGFEETGRLPQVGRKFDRWLDVVFVTLLLEHGR